MDRLCLFSVLWQCVFIVVTEGVISFPSKYIRRRKQPKKQANKQTNQSIHYLINWWLYMSFSYHLVKRSGTKYVTKNTWLFLIILKTFFWNILHIWISKKKKSHQLKGESNRRITTGLTGKNGINNTHESYLLDLWSCVLRIKVWKSRKHDR